MGKWIFICIVSLLIPGLVYSIIKTRIIQKKQIRLFKSVFTPEYFHFPIMEFRYVYWWPTFKIKFKTKSDLERARKLGLMKKFEEETQNIYKGISGFDAKRAITYEFPTDDDNFK